MADNIATYNDLPTIAYIGSTPWHGLGKRITPAQARDLDYVQRAAGLDWRVATRSLYLSNVDAIDGARSLGERTELGQAVVRVGDGRILGVVGPAYTPIQNSEAFDVLRPAVEQLGLTIAVAGALGNGATCWALAQLPQSVDVTGTGDTVNGYALFRWAHDGTISLLGDATPIRVVCQNTLNQAVNGKLSGIVRIRHTKNAQQRLDAAAKAVEQLTASLIATGETFSALARKRLSAAEVAAFVETVFPAEADADGTISATIAKRRQTVGRLVWEGVGAQLAGSDANGTTAWAAYNAVTEYFDHVRPAEAPSKAGRDRANVSALFGGNADVKARALQVARELVAA